MPTRLNVFGQHLAELDAPLVKTVDAPDGTADKHAVLLQSQQRAQAGGRQFIQQQKGAGPVARKVPVAACVRLAQHESLGLRQRVGQQLVMRAAQMVGRFFNRDKFHRHHVRSLVQHLEKSMLAVGARLAPEHWRRAIGQRLTFTVHVLAVALHLQLLQVSRPAPQSAVIRRDAAAGEAMKVAVPDVQQAQPHR